ncbi:MAG TPA: hypothetical protein PLK31_11470, partial [Chloroflexota bacterium]|nr:hypothetical protein [Chloroflexota bacterium]
RLAVEASRDAALAEAAAVREAATTAVAAETDAWGDTAQDAVDTAVAQSAAAREAAETAIAAETTAWSETAKDTIDTAVAQSTAAREAAAAEAAAWAETAQEAVDRAVAESAALRQQAGEQIKFAVTFTPVSTAIEELGTAVQEKWTEVTYDAIPDIKYPVQFMPKQTNGPENGEPAAPSDTAVDEAVDRLLEEGVQVADDTIRQALAKAAQEENA